MVPGVRSLGRVCVCGVSNLWSSQVIIYMHLHQTHSLSFFLFSKQTNNTSSLAQIRVWINNPNLTSYQHAHACTQTKHAQLTPLAQNPNGWHLQKLSRNSLAPSSRKEAIGVAQHTAFGRRRPAPLCRWLIGSLAKNKSRSGITMMSAPYASEAWREAAGRFGWREFWSFSFANYNEYFAVSQRASKKRRHVVG